MTENEKLRALLTEAHQALVDSGYDESIPVFRNITAALAEPVDSATEVVESETVEMRWDWHEVNSPNRLAALLMDGTRVECRKADYNGVMGWSWNTMIQHGGFVTTLEEAKAAAIRAARGLK